MRRIIFFIVFIVLSCVQTSYSSAVPTDTECSEYDEVYYEKPDNDALSKIKLERMDIKTQFPSSLSSASKEFSPQRTKHYIMQDPDFMKSKDPWNTYIYIFGNQANPVKLKITFLDHGNGGVRAKWLNEKLLFVQVWWGRIISTDLILNVDSAKWLYSQNANYGLLIMPCDQKMRNRR